MKKHILSLLLLSLINIGLNAQDNYTLRGFIKSAETGEPLIYATIADTLSGNGTLTNEEGFYSLSLPNNKAFLHISYVGYTQENREIEAIDSDKMTNFSLDNAVILEEVRVSAKNTESVHEQTLMGLQSLPIERIKNLPSLAGEPDVLKAITYLPGVSNGREGTSSLHVRGGGRDQNLVLMDGAPIYGTSHVGGFLSIFNTQAIKKVDLYKGGFPARYGGRLSSVLDIKTKEGNRVKRQGEFNIGLLASTMSYEGPLNNGKTSYFISGRSSYYALLGLPSRLKYKNNSVANYSTFSFYDLNGKISHKISDTKQVFLSFYNGKDKQINADKSTFGENNSTISLSNTSFSLGYNQTLGARTFFRARLVYGNYQSTFTDENETFPNPEGETEEVLRNRNESFSDIRDYSLKLDWDFLPNARHTLRYGVNATLHNLQPGRISTVIETDEQGGENLDTLRGITEIQRAFETAIYAEDEIRLTKKINLNIGVRAVIFRESDHNFYALEPRASLRFLVGKQMSVKANYTRMTQFMHLLVNNYQGFEREVWLNSKKEVAPERSEQFSVGLFADSKSKIWQLGIEGFYKNLSGLIDYRSPTGLSEELSAWEDLIEQSGTGKAYGAELSLEKTEGRLTSVFSYTLSKSTRQFENINFGKEYPYLYDRRHDISLIINYQLNPKWSLSSNFVYQTGRAFTFTEGYAQETPYSYAFNVLEGRNNRRLPDYHRLDIAAKREWTGKKGRENRLTFNIFNAYNRQNASYLFLDAETKKVKQISLFPLLPSMSYGLKF